VSKTSLYLNRERAAAVKASGRSVLDLIDLGLTVLRAGADGRDLADIIAAGMAARGDTRKRKRANPRAAGAAAPRGAQPPGPPPPESAADMAAYFRGRGGG
jgi:hypothetical protein